MILYVYNIIRIIDFFLNLLINKKDVFEMESVVYDPI